MGPAAERQRAARITLTFDEFKMWLHLGGDYWTRTSFDAMVGIAGLLRLLAAAPLLQFRPRHWTTATLAPGVAAFGYLLWRPYRSTTTVIMPHLQRIEAYGPR